MEQYSDEDYSFSDSDIEEYSEKPYEALRTGVYKVRSMKGNLRCPFCTGKKKQEYTLKDLHQHASSVSKGAAFRSAKQKATHLALARYLEVDLAFGSSKVTQQDVKEEVYCWPWIGIIVNIMNDESGVFLRTFARYKPLGVEVFKSELDQTSIGFVKFEKEMTGRKNAHDFELLFEASESSKKNWIAKKGNLGSCIYGWCAREEDYCEEGQIGMYLRKNTELKTILDIVCKEKKDREAIANLGIEIEIKNQNLVEMEFMFKEKALSLSRMDEEKDELQLAIYAGQFSR